MDRTTPAITIARERWRRALHMSPWHIEPRLNPAARSLALTLLDCFVNRKTFDESGQLVAYPTEERLAKCSARDVRNVRAGLRSLEQQGVIECVKGAGPGRGSRYAFCEGWRDDTERQLEELGILDAWPDKRLPRPIPVTDLPGNRMRSSGNPGRVHPGMADEVIRQPYLGHTVDGQLSSKSNPANAVVAKGRQAPQVAVRPIEAPREAAKNVSSVRYRAGATAAAAPAGSRTDQALRRYTFDGAIRELRSDKIRADKAFELFQFLYPKQDQDPDKLRGAWHNIVIKSKSDPRPILRAALIWRAFHRCFPEDFVPYPGRWLKNGHKLPWRADEGGITSVDTLVYDCTGDELLDYIGGEVGLKSPFDELTRAVEWRDSDDIQNYRPAFNRQLSDGTDPQKIIDAARAIEKRCNMKGTERPLFGQFLKNYQRSPARVSGSL